jgi:hypothetical protein
LVAPHPRTIFLSSGSATQAGITASPAAIVKTLDALLESLLSLAGKLLALKRKRTTMTTDPERETFKLIHPDGSVIMTGSLSAVTEPILDSKSRRVAERLVRDAAVAAGKVAEIDRRADAVIERERRIGERERALREEAVRRLCDSADDLAQRLDAYEQAQVRAALAALPDPDDPRSHSDDLEAVHEAPHNFDKEVLEAALEREVDDAGPGDLPPELDLPAAPLSEAEPAGLGTRGVQDARKRRFREPKPRKGRDWPAQPVAISLNSED